MYLQFQRIPSDPGIIAIEEAYKSAGAPWQGVLDDAIGQAVQGVKDPQYQQILYRVLHILADGLVAYERQHEPKHCIGHILKTVILSFTTNTNKDHHGN